uniref:Uncharacterized protein n=1 Tax=Timema tahoe TaxID=61484 RepID=A0A7R9IJK4_9NEOP|nr:unnamed protein product [Timema tahoe]
MCTRIWPAPPVARGQDVTRESIKSCWQVYNGMSSLFIRLSTTRGVLGGCSIHGHSATNMTRTGSITAGSHKHLDIVARSHKQYRMVAGSHKQYRMIAGSHKLYHGSQVTQTVPHDS